LDFFYGLCTRSVVYSCLRIFNVTTLKMKKVKFAKVYNYERTGKLNSQGSAVVYIRAYLKGKSKYFPTGVYIAPKNWDKKNHKVHKHPNQARLNQLIRDLETQLENFELEVVKRDGEISLEQLALFDKEVIDISFTDFYHNRLEERSNRISKQSFTDQNQTLDKLKSFRKIVYFHDLTHKFIAAFDSYLFKLGLHANTIAKHHKNLKTYINLSIEYNYLDINKAPYKSFKVKSIPTVRVFLDIKELTAFEKLRVENDDKKMIQDFFLFCSWTGLRYSDASKLDIKNFNEESNGFVLSFTAEKTSKPHRLNLSKLFQGKPEKLIKEYIEKYNDFYHDNLFSNRYIFFGLTNQYINRELKELVKPLDIRPVVKEKISCHVARHTFGTIMAGKIQLHILQRLMQHSKIKETMIYVHLNSKMMDEELDKVNW